MNKENVKCCQNEIQGEIKDVVFSNKDYKVRSRDCSILHSDDELKNEQKYEIEKTARKLGIHMLGRRCPFYGNKSHQQDCPFFK